MDHYDAASGILKISAKRNFPVPCSHPLSIHTLIREILANRCMVEAFNRARETTAIGSIPVSKVSSFVLKDSALSPPRVHFHTLPPPIVVLKMTTALHRLNFKSFFMLPEQKFNELDRFQMWRKRMRCKK